MLAIRSTNHDPIGLRVFDEGAEANQTKQDEIALRQLHVLREFQGPREKKLRLSDVKKMFAELRDLA